MDDQLVVSVRAPQVEDAQAIANVHCVTWRKAYQGIIPATLLAQMDEATYAENWRRALLAEGPGQYRVACVGGAIIAFTTFGPARDPAFGAACELVALNVHPQYWRRGVGAKLVTVVTSAVQSHYPQLYLWVAINNEPAKQFYRQQGFKETGESRQCPLANGVYEQAMIKELGH